jgi:rare lipoprotein A
MLGIRAVLQTEGRVSVSVTAAVTVVCVLAVVAVTEPVEPEPVSGQLGPGTPQTAVASWYGPFHHGRLTASGERFNMHGMTAAHRSLPLGSVLLVENPGNGRTVRVRVNDRGPYKDRRELDLSYAAARALGGVRDGLIVVRYRVVHGR